MTPKEQLEQMKLDQFKRDHPNVPAYAIHKPKKSKSESQQLMNVIQKFIKLSGGFCEQVQTKGTWREDIGRHTAGSYTKGSSDLHIMLIDIYGCLIVWKCEVKIGKDIQSEDQKKYQSSIETFNKRIISGSSVIYSIVKTFDDFIIQYNNLRNT